MTNLNEQLRAEIREAYTEHTGNSAIDYDGREWLDFEGGYLQCLHRAPAAAPAPEAASVLLKLCDQLEAMKHTMFLMPGTGQHYSYLVREDVYACVEQARAALAAAPPAPAAAPIVQPVADALKDLRNVRQWMLDVVPAGTDFTISKIAKLDRVIAAITSSAGEVKP